MQHWIIQSNGAKWLWPGIRLCTSISTKILTWQTSVKITAEPRFEFEITLKQIISVEPYHFIVVQLHMWSRRSCYLADASISLTGSILFFLFMHESSTEYFAVIFHSIHLSSTVLLWLLFIIPDFHMVLILFFWFLINFISVSSYILDFSPPYTYRLLLLTSLLLVHFLFPPTRFIISPCIHIESHSSCHFLPERLMLLEVGTEFVSQCFRDRQAQKAIKDTQDHQGWW